MTGLSLDRVSFARADRLVIDGVDCTVPPGRLGALVGPNGSGKSTLLHLIAGLEGTDRGSIRLDEADLAALPRRQRARRIALVQQQLDAEVDITVADAVTLARIPHLPTLGAPGDEDRRIIAAALARTGAAQFSGRRFAELSGGERQRVLLARGLAQEPELLLLDEPTNHLDIAAALEVLQLVRSITAGGLTVLAALHDLNLAMTYADTVIVLAAGRVIAAGPPAEVLTPVLIRAVYGVDAELIRRDDLPPVIAFTPLVRGSKAHF